MGRGTEGGLEPYKLSIPKNGPWGDASSVIDNSGYSIGTIQVDLGQRGEWPLGATEDRPLKHDEATYVDAIIDQAAKYAKEHHLPFTEDREQLRAGLLTHGNGEHNRSTLEFINKDTYNSINAWTTSEEGQNWIHTNIDYPQVKSATQTALDMVDHYGKNIPEDRRLETIAILAKTANQHQSSMNSFQKVLENGGNYDAVLAKANKIREKVPYYDGPKAAGLAEQYENAFNDPDKAAALNRAHTKVGDANFNPSTEKNDQDIKEALKTIKEGLKAIEPHNHVHVLHKGSHGRPVTDLQTQLQTLECLGRTDAHGKPLPLGHFGQATEQALRKFQSEHGLPSNGKADSTTLDAIHKAIEQHKQADPKTDAAPTQAAPPTSSPSQNSPGNPSNAFRLMDPDLRAIVESNGDPAVMEQSAQNYRNSPSGQLFDMQAQAAAARVQPGAPEQQVAETPRVQQSGPSIG